MKKGSLLILALAAFSYSHAQAPGEVIEGTSTYIKCKSYSLSKPLRDLIPMDTVFEGEVYKKEHEGKNERIKFIKTNPNATPREGEEDPVWQREMGSREIMSNPIVAWNGMSGSGFPPDPSGAAGISNHYVQAVNTSYRVYNKTGGTVTAQFNLSALWPGSTNDGDPIVMFDKYADRWFISQFQVSGNEILIAISTTSDPTGSYHLYTFVPAASQFPDYPKYSIWQDGYYMTNNYSTKRVTVFERDQMLIGNPSAGMIVRTMPTTPSNGFFCPLPADADGNLPPGGTPCYIFSYEDDGWFSSNIDQVRIYQFATDWTAGTATLTFVTGVPVAAFDASWSPSWNDITQPGTSQKLDAIGGVLNYRAQYRRWAGYNTVVMCWAVKVTSTQSGIRWVELRETGGVWSLYQEGTYAPDGHSRWLGSIAMDDYGSIGLAYAVSSGTVSPSLRFTGRLASDPLGQMTAVEMVGGAGTVSQTGTNRYGDYSHTSMDPDGLTFWHTGEYYGGSKRTRIFSFRITSAFDIEEMQNYGTFNVFLQGENFMVNATAMKTDDEVMVDLFDINGKLVEAKKIIPAGGSFNTQFATNGLAKGTYLVRVGNLKFQRVVKVVLN